MDNNEVQGVKFSQFPSSTPTNTDTVVGLHAGYNARFTVTNLIAAVRAALTSIFVSKSDVGSAGGVASLDSSGKVPSTQLPAIPSTAAAVTYDNTDSGLTAENVQEAIDELAAGAGGGGVDPETIAPVETTTTATVAHPLGTIFYLNGVLYRALSDIAVGGTINTAAGGNATQTTVAQNFKRTVTLTSAEYAQLSAAEKAADIVYIITDEPITYANQAQLAYVESGSTASRAYAVGEYFCWRGLLYRVTAAISSGGAFTPETNCVQTSATKMLTLRSGTFTTNSNGRVSSGLYWTQGYIVQAWAQNREVRVYSNSSNAQGFFVLDTSGNPVASTSVSITYLVYNYNL